MVPLCVLYYPAAQTVVGSYPRGIHSELAVKVPDCEPKEQNTALAGCRELVANSSIPTIFGHINMVPSAFRELP